MKFISLFTVALAATTSSLSFADAEALWKKNKDVPGFEQYSADFAQYNNHFRLDERDGCYSRAAGSVTLFLVVTDEAKVETVVADVASGQRTMRKRRALSAPIRVFQRRSRHFLHWF